MVIVRENLLIKEQNQRLLYDCLKINLTLRTEATTAALVVV
jgi:hypothetical protein